SRAPCGLSGPHPLPRGDGGFWESGGNWPEGPFSLRARHAVQVDEKRKRDAPIFSLMTRFVCKRDLCTVAPCWFVRLFPNELRRSIRARVTPRSVLGSITLSVRF